MLKKILCGFLAVAMAATAFAGCSSNGNGSSSAAGSSEAGSTPAASSEAGSGEETNLRLALWDYDVTGYDKVMVEAFQEKNPNIKVEVTSTPNADYANKISVMLAGNDNVDVYYIKSNTDYPTFVLKNFVMNLDELITKNNFDLAPYGTVLDQHYKMDGSLYALPYRTNDWVLFYNKKIFDDAGVDYPSNDMTWEQVRELSKKVTSGEGGDKIYGLYFYPKVSFILPAMVGKIPNYDNMTSDFTDLGYSMNWLIGMQNDDQTYETYSNAKSMNQDQTYFFKGKSAMFYNGSWFVQLLKINSDKVDFEWGVAKSPYWEGTEKAGFATSTPIAINSKTEKVDASWKLLEFLAGAEGAKILADNMMVPGYMSDEVMEAYKTSTGIDDSSYEALTNNTTYGFGAPNELNGLVTAALQEEFELALTGNQSVDDTVKRMEERRTEIIEQNK